MSETSGLASASWYAYTKTVNGIVTTKKTYRYGDAMSWPEEASQLNIPFMLKMD